MRGVIAGAAVLCLLAAQPAVAAWTTSGQGSAGAKGGTLQPVVITSCAKGTGNSTSVTWNALQGATSYTVSWQQGNGDFNKSASTTSTAYSVPLSIDRVRVQASVGTWGTTPAQANCP
ncbi:hypothetical protein [Lentzea sp.]|uniref:hypothetical protein n=1 Tax=Lentzea sp. TaxID=56099 RepID=UPI002ED21692